MQFPPGSWFTVWDRLDAHRVPFNRSVDDFRAMLMTEIRTFFKKLPQQDSMQLLDAQPCVSEQRFEELQHFELPLYKPDRAGPELVPDGTSQNCFLTFHGTNSMEAQMSIINHGYLLPGEQHPLHGYSLSMSTGNLYGDGLYSSSQPKIAAIYAFHDIDDTTTLLVNVMFPGNVACVTRDYSRLPAVYHSVSGAQLLPPKGPNGRYVAPACKRFSQPVFMGHEYGCCFRPVEPEGAYDWAHNSNTLTPDYSRMWICAHSSSIVPVAFVKVRHGGESVARPLSTVAPKAEALTDGIPVHAQCNSAFIVTHLFDDYYALPEFVYERCSLELSIRRHVVIPRSILFDKSFRTAVESYAAGTCDKSDFFHFYGSAGSAAVSCTAKQLPAVCATELRREKCHRAEDGIQAAFDAICGGRSGTARAAKGHTAAARAPDSERRCYHVVLLVVDATTIFDEECVERLTKEFADPLSGLYINVKLLFSFAFGAGKKEERLVPYFHFKHTFQYEGIFERLLYDASKTPWAEALEVIEGEMLNIGARSTESYLGDFSVKPVELQCEERIGDGFVSSLDGYPQPTGRFSSRVVFKGVPRWFSVNGTRYDATVMKFHHNRSERSVAAAAAASSSTGMHLLRKFRSTIAKNALSSVSMQLIRFATVACSGRGQDDEEVMTSSDEIRRETLRIMNLNCAVIISFLNKLRSSVAAGGGRDRVRMHAANIHHIARRVAAVARHPLTDLKIGRTLLQTVAGIVGDITTLAACPFSGAWYAAFERMRFARKILRRVKYSAEATEETMTEEQVQAALESQETLGVGLRVLRSSASEIEPWLTVVQYVSAPLRLHLPDRFETLFRAGDMFRASQLEEDVVDQFGEVVTDMLIPPECASGKVERMYSAYVVTRNPFLTMPSQTIALRSISWVRTVESVLLRCRGVMTTTVEMLPEEVVWIEEHIELAISLARSIHAFYGTAENSLLLADAFAAPSLCELLARRITFKSSTNKVAEAMPVESRFDLLAESLVRTVHAYAKSTKKGEEELLCWLLGIDRETAQANEQYETEYHVDIERCARRSSRLLGFSYNNCSPFAVVAVLGFLDLLQKSSTLSDIVSAFQRKKISMKNFLHQYERSKGQREWPARETQVALFVFAVCSHTLVGSSRLFSSACQQPLQYITSAVQRLMTSFTRRRNALKELSRYMKARAAHRKAIQSQRAAEWSVFHTISKTFTAEEVDEMNRLQRHRGVSVRDQRVVDLRFELLPKSGLLKHHCCYPSCPQYLCCFATKTDILKRQRHGIMNHLKFNDAGNNYVPGFHVMAKHFYRCDFIQFRERMDEHFRHCRKYQTLVNRADHLRTAWQAHQQRAVSE